MSRFQTSDGINIHFEDEGDGLPILCLAGLTRNTRDFDFVAPHLDGVRLIRMDYRGRGQSDWGAGPEDYTLPIEGRDIMELLAHLGLAQVAVLGTSRGGLHAMGLAAVAPDALLGVALNDVGPEIDMSGMGRIVTYLGQNPASKTHEEHAALMDQVMRGFDNVPEGRWLQDARNSYRAGDAGLEITYDPALRDATAAAVDAGLPDLWPFFDAFPQRPLALIWGQNSDLLTPDTVDKMAARRPDMWIARVPDRGHVPFLDEPESLAVLHQWVEAMR
jgi:pimeloyl-ACP methyl ester carboxylesterase